MPLLVLLLLAPPDEIAEREQAAGNCPRGLLEISEQRVERVTEGIADERDGGHPSHSSALKRTNFFRSIPSTPAMGPATVRKPKMKRAQNMVAAPWRRIMSLAAPISSSSR